MAETIQVSVNRWMDKQNIVYPYTDYSVIERKHWYILQQGTTLKTFCSVKQASHKESHIVYVYMNWTEQANLLQQQKAD